MAQLEVCVDTIEGARAAAAGGADRIELCAALSEGGLTPSAGLMRAAAKLPVPSYAMIRPRCGMFYFSEFEIEIMLQDIAAARIAGLAGVVLGAQDETGGLDLPLLRQLMDAAQGLGTTLHRVIDVVPEPLLALDQAIELGFERVLTSGAMPTAQEGARAISRMVERADGRISVMPGCGLDADSVAPLIRGTGVNEVHAACQIPAAGEPAFSDFDPANGRQETSELEVRKMIRSLREL